FLPFPFLGGFFLPNSPHFTRQDPEGRLLVEGVKGIIKNDSQQGVRVAVLLVFATNATIFRDNISLSGLHNVCPFISLLIEQT
ncbi:hypothetical protein KCA24_34555, partial [Escherichia coli]|nr:hypothetical protein [Escherichia coli]